MHSGIILKVIAYSMGIFTFALAAYFLPKLIKSIFVLLWGYKKQTHGRDLMDDITALKLKRYLKIPGLLKKKDKDDMK